MRRDAICVRRRPARIDRPKRAVTNVARPRVCSLADEAIEMNNVNQLSKIRAAMRHAASIGYNPYDSHATQARVMERRWKMESGARKTRERLERSEAAANRWLELELRRNGHSPFKQAG